jgi:hypothetical protein
MKKRHYWKLSKTAAVAALAGVASTVAVQAQSSDALIDKLVDKGILTVKEANDLREEADRNFNQAYATKTGMADWVNAMKISGDIRGRYENFSSDGSFKDNNGTHDFVERDRFRYRLRLALTVSMADNLEAGVRLTSDDPANKNDYRMGGDPISGNSTMQYNGSKKYIYIDEVYGKWYALNTADWNSALTIGKMENPLTVDDMVFDPDYTPEGAALQTAYNINDKHTLKMNTGGFVLNEIGDSTHDSFLVAGQVRWDAAWTKKVSTSFGVTGLGIGSAESLTNVPTSNYGNARKSDGSLAYSYNPYVLDASTTYLLDSFPLYNGPCPIKFGGEYMNNPAAPSGADNYAWNLGAMLGKSGKKGTWDLSYTYKWLGANAWYEQLVDSDFGAYYSDYSGQNYTQSGVPANTAGYVAGTNVKGHVVRFAYSPTDSLTLSVKWFLTDLINSYPSGSDSGMSRLQVDGTLKF